MLSSICLHLYQIGSGRTELVCIQDLSSPLSIAEHMPVENRQHVCEVAPNDIYCIADDFTKLFLAKLGIIVIMFAYMRVCINYFMNLCILYCIWSVIKYQSYVIFISDK